MDVSFRTPPPHRLNSPDSIDGRKIDVEKCSCFARNLQVAEVTMRRVGEGQLCWVSCFYMHECINQTGTYAWSASLGVQSFFAIVRVHPSEQTGPRNAGTVHCTFILLHSFCVLGTSELGWVGAGLTSRGLFFPKITWTKSFRRTAHGTFCIQRVCTVSFFCCLAYAYEKRMLLMNARHPMSRNARESNVSLWRKSPSAHDDVNVPPW